MAVAPADDEHPVGVGEQLDRAGDGGLAEGDGDRRGVRLRLLRRGAALVDAPRLPAERSERRWSRTSSNPAKPRLRKSRLIVALDTPAMSASSEAR